MVKKREDLNIIGVDFFFVMLNEVVKKSKNLNIVWKEVDVLCLLFKDFSFLVVVIFFGLRNIVDYEKVLKEMIRVVKKDGFIYCLDFFVLDCLWI